MAKAKSHPLDSLTFKPSRSDKTLPQQATTAPEIPASPTKSVTPPPAPEEETRSSNVTLPVKVWEWIDAKHAEARSKGGKPLRKAAIIRAVFDVVMAADVDLAGTQSEEELVSKFKRAIQQ